MDKILICLFIAAISALLTMIVFKRVFKRDCKKIINDYLNEVSNFYNWNLYIEPTFDNLDRIYTEQKMREHAKIYIEECIIECANRIDKM